MTELQKRCVDISYRHKLTHVSSVLNTVNLIDDIYKVRHVEDPFVLGNAHASLALYVVLEKHKLCDAEEMVERHGTHTCRDVEHGVWVSGGSLGQAETVAVGMALANVARSVWLVSSDGALMEGSVYEAMRIAPPNLKRFTVCNGYGAYSRIPRWQISTDWEVISVPQENYPYWLRGLPGHYLTLTKEQHDELMK